jgi:hypothetical protein
MIRQTELDIAQAKRQNKQFKIIDLNYYNLIKKTKVLVWNWNKDLLAKVELLR